MNMRRRIGQNHAPMAQPNVTAGHALWGDRFAIGWMWYPGITVGSVIPHNKVRQMDTTIGSIRMTPPTIPVAGVQLASVHNGVRFAADAYTDRIAIVMPPVPRR